MSGGHWQYSNDMLAHEILGHYFDIGCGLEGKEHDTYLKDAVHQNPLQDPEISALVYDVFRLLHSYDYAVSGDTDIEDYQRDVRSFKNRWFKKARTEQVREMIDICADNWKKELYQAFGCASDRPE